MSRLKKPLKKIRNKLTGNVDARLESIHRDIQQVSQRQTEIENKLDKIDRSLELSNATGTYVINKNEIIVKIFTGAKLLLDRKDRGIVPNLALDKIWEAPISNAWLRVAKNNDVILDIGANFGYFSVLAAQQTQRTARIVAFEANTELKYFIDQTLEMNSMQECIAVEYCAVSNTSGRAKLNIVKDYVASSSLHNIKGLNDHSFKKDYKLEHSIETTTITIDDYCQKHGISQLNLVKMDIEGHEDRAYDGMRKIVKNSPNLTLFLEFTKNAYDDPKGFFETLAKDFEYIYVIDGDGRLILQNNKNYAKLIDKHGDWVMPVFSKRPDLQ